MLVDDHPLVREALRTALSRELDLQVCGEAENQRQALAAVAACKPALAIVDLALKDSDGLELIREISHRYPEVLTLVLSMHDEMHFAERAVRAGANGYISKQEATTRILDAVRTVLRGEIYWSEGVAAQVASKAARPDAAARRLPYDLLSERELQVFEFIGMGRGTAQTAASLHIDVTTVESHRSRIKRKLGCGTAADLLQAAIRWRLATAYC